MLSAIISFVLSFLAGLFKPDRKDDDIALEAAQNEVTHETADIQSIRQQAQNMAGRPTNDDEFAARLRQYETGKPDRQ
jgi:hypothetical protein